MSKNDPMNHEIINGLRELIRNEIKAAMAEYEIETHGLTKSNAASKLDLQALQTLYNERSLNAIAKLESLES